ncbi:glyoxylate/hydroxypyruvate reductase A [Nitrobacteraceae bacterium AZCC 1564]
MGKAALAVLINGGTDNWSPERWRQRFNAVCKDRQVALLPGDACRLEDVGYAAVWKPTPGALAGFPNLKAVFNLGAGVDALIADSTLPNVPIVRVAIGDLTGRMTEYVVMHVLMHHRQQPYLSQSQQNKVWAPKHQSAASEISVGVMGLGTLGRDAADVLKRLGFRVVGWSASPKSLPGIECYSGQAGLKEFLARTNILVCLLPLTPDTRYILNRSVFSQLDRNSPLGAPVLINAGRGGLQNEADILACLDDGTLGAVSLDVFETEPLPAQSPFWSHPKVILSPHNAADTDPTEISAYVARQIEQFEAGRPLDNVVDLKRGY